MATEGLNVNQEIQQVRDAFFTPEETQQFNKLMRNRKQQSLHEKLSLKNPEKLFARATEIMQNIEAGKYNEDEMAEAEYLIMHYLAACEDATMAAELEL